VVAAESAGAVAGDVFFFVASFGLAAWLFRTGLRRERRGQRGAIALIVVAAFLVLFLLSYLAQRVS
jgi:hypothetical protein